MQPDVPATKISVIIPTYNRRDYLKACLKSVRNQTTSPHEIIIVDDGSTDGTRAWVERQDDCVLIAQENLGPGAARNAGAQIATGNYLAFLDSDDLWRPWSLAVFESVVLQADLPSLIFASFVDFSDPVEFVDLVHDEDIRISQHLNFLETSDLGYFAGAGMMVIQRDAFLAKGGFVEDRMNAEDHDLALRLGLEAGFVKILDPIQIGHRVHDSNEMLSSEKSIQGLMRLIEREKAGVYPGGSAHKTARRKIISHHCRPQIIALCQSGHVKAARRLFAETVYWHIGLGRIRILMFAGLMLLRYSLIPSRESKNT